MKFYKVFLAISVPLFVFSLTEVGSEIGYGILKPASAVFFVAFLIWKLLDKETALFDAEHEQQMRTVMNRPAQGKSHHGHMPRRPFDVSHGAKA